jgi:FAD/FMN-containing dehydrogenase
MITTDQLYADVRELDAKIAGSAVGPADEGWDTARLAWNLAIDQRPAMVVSVRSVEDVQTVVDYARERGLRVAAQGTGHNAAALGSLEHTVLVKTHEMRGVEIDVERRIARVESGAIWLDVTEKSAPHKLVPTLGSAHDVGVTGFTLGGGFCWLGRKHGLSADNVVAIELVTADGGHVRVTEEDDSGLFWALRGGGGSFGVVTALEIKLHHEPDIYATSIMFPVERSAEVLNVWREYVETLSDDTTSYIRMLHLPPLPEIPEPLRGGSFVNVEVVHLGTVEEGRAVSQPIRDLGPLFEALEGAQDAASLSYFHMDPPEPVPALGGGHMLMDELDAEAVDQLVSLAGTPGGPLLFLEVRHIGGALGRDSDSAVSKLDGKFVLFGAGMVMDADMAVGLESQLEKVELTMAPWDNGKRYLNFTEHPTDPGLFYESARYARLRAVKADVDPGDLFQSNHPIPPAR